MVTVTLAVVMTLSQEVCDISGANREEARQSLNMSVRALLGWDI